MTKKQAPNRAILIDQAHNPPYSLLYEKETGLLLDSKYIVTPPKRAQEDFHITLSNIEKCETHEELNTALSSYKRAKLYRPIDFDNYLTRGDYGKLMGLCSKVVGVSHLFITKEELKALWGCGDSYMYRVVRDFTEGGLMRIVYHRGEDYLLEIHPFYVWKDYGEWRRWRAIFRYMKAFHSSRKISSQ